MCACKEDQTTTKVNEKSNREVVCSKEWILDELNSKWCSPAFYSRAEGVRSLDWEIELRCLKVDNYILILCLLTDINNEIEVNHTCSIEDTDGRVIFEDSTKTKFHKLCSSKPFFITHLKPGPLKMKFQLTYVDSIRVLNLEKSVMVLLGNLDKMLADSKFSDLTLCVKDREFTVHKAILAATSPFFAKLFTLGLKDNKLDMGDMDPDTVQEMLKFIYTGISPNLHKMAQELLIAADRYELEMLKNMAEIELIFSITQDNAKDLLVLADKCSASELKDKVNKFLEDNAEFAKKNEKYFKDYLFQHDPQSTDVILCVKGREFKAHKKLLTSESSVFASMFKSDTKEKQENRVEIHTLVTLHDLEPETVKEMLNFIYTKRTHNIHKMAKELLIAADRYALEILMGMAEFELIGTISVANAKELLVLADKCSASELKDKVEKFLATDNAVFADQEISKESENPGHLSHDLKLTDVTLCSQDQEFRVHKHMLSDHSSIFATIFKNDSTKDRVEIKDLVPDTVRKMIEFIYTGSVPNLPLIAHELLVAAHLYKIEKLKTIAEDELISSITMDNVLNRLLQADNCSAIKLHSEAKKFIIDNNEKLEVTNEWKLMMKKNLGLMYQIKLEIDEKREKNGSEIDLK